MDPLTFIKVPGGVQNASASYRIKQPHMTEIVEKSLPL